MKIQESAFSFSLDHSIINRIDESLFSFQKFGITHFGNIRFFKNNTAHRIANNISWTNIFFENKFYNAIDLDYFQNLTMNHSYYRVLFGEPLTKHDKALYEFGLWNFLLIYKKSPAHLDYWFFSGKPNDCKVIDFYLNNLQNLNDFISLFEISNQDIFSVANKRNTYSPEGNSGIFSAQSSIKSLIISTENIETNKTFIDVSFSQREQDCLFYISKGRSMKETAAYLGISPRTVETHINNMKKKTGYNSRSKLLDFAEVIFSSK